MAQKCMIKMADVNGMEIVNVVEEEMSGNMYTYTYAWMERGMEMVM
jgi:hypothetical protein